MKQISTLIFLIIFCILELSFGNEATTYNELFQKIRWLEELDESVLQNRISQLEKRLQSLEKIDESNNFSTHLNQLKESLPLRRNINKIFLLDELVRLEKNLTHEEQEILHFLKNLRYPNEDLLSSSQISLLPQEDDFESRIISDLIVFEEEVGDADSTSQDHSLFYLEKNIPRKEIFSPQHFQLLEKNFTYSETHIENYDNFLNQFGYFIPSKQPITINDLLPDIIRSVGEILPGISNSPSYFDIVSVQDLITNTVTSYEMIEKLKPYTEDSDKCHLKRHELAIQHDPWLGFSFEDRYYNTIRISYEYFDIYPIDPLLVGCLVSRENTLFLPSLLNYTYCSSGRSSAVGLTQITKKTLQVIQNKNKSIVPQFTDEEDYIKIYGRLLKNPELQIERAMAILTDIKIKKPEAIKLLREKARIGHPFSKETREIYKSALKKYYGHPCNKRSENYAKKIITCTECIKNGKSTIQFCLKLSKDSDSQSEQLNSACGNLL